MSIKFITRPYSDTFGKGKGGYRGRIVNRGSRTFDDISQAVADRLGTSRHHVEAVFSEVMDEVIRDSLGTARLQKLGEYGSFTINLRGRFTGIDDHFDPKRHWLELKFTNGAKMKNLKPAFELENEAKGGVVTLTAIAGDPDRYKMPVTSPYYMVWGLDTFCVGQNCQLCEGEDTATWSTELADGSTHSGPLTVFQNDAGVLDFRWPSSIPEAAVGRQVTLTFCFRGPRVDSAPVTRNYKVPLLSATAP